MSAAPTAQLLVGPDGSRRLRLGDPAAGNPLSKRMVEAATKCVEDCYADATRVLWLEGAGRHFCSGLHVKETLRLEEDAIIKHFRAIECLLSKIAYAPFVTMALVQGAAVGSGADLVVACDFRIGASRARFRFPGPQFGVALGTRRLARRVGSQASSELVLTGRWLDAAGALACGLLSHVADDDANLATIAADLSDKVTNVDGPGAAMIMSLVRGGDAARDRRDLEDSLARPGLSDRMRAYYAAAVTP